MTPRLEKVRCGDCLVRLLLQNRRNRLLFFGFSGRLRLFG